jgi:hypothetical protein
MIAPLIVGLVLLFRIAAALGMPSFVRKQSGGISNIVGASLSTRFADEEQHIFAREDT